MTIAALLTSYKNGSVTQAEAVAEIESLIEVERIQLRDQFAGQYLQGAIVTAFGGAILNPPLIAAGAYAMADAMLEARKS